jgi:PPOX class probable F420-dependent enzyme
VPTGLLAEHCDIRFEEDRDHRLIGHDVECVLPWAFRARPPLGSGEWLQCHGRRVGSSREDLEEPCRRHIETVPSCSVEDAMMRRRVAAARVGRLATVDSRGQPHIVPICFALDGDEIVTAVDRKPKTTTELRRVANIRTNAAVTLLVDQYDEDWEQLWWVRVDGRARILQPGPGFEEAIAPLHEKYRGQYGLHGPPGPAILMVADRWVGWSAR